MECSFDVNFSGTAQQLLDKAKSATQSYGSLNGDTSGGAFNVSALGISIKGNYTISGNTASINVTDKPFFLSCDTIKRYIDSKIH